MTAEEIGRKSLKEMTYREWLIGQALSAQSLHDAIAEADWVLEKLAIESEERKKNAGKTE